MERLDSKVREERVRQRVSLGEGLDWRESFNECISRIGMKPKSYNCYWVMITGLVLISRS